RAATIVRWPILIIMVMGLFVILQEHETAREVWGRWKKPPVAGSLERAETLGQAFAPVGGSDEETIRRTADPSTHQGQGRDRPSCHWLIEARDGSEGRPSAYR